MRITSNLPTVISKLNQIPAEIDKGAERAAYEMGNTLTTLSKREIQGRRKEGEKAVAGRPPKNRTGNLRRSIKAEYRRKGFGTYTAEVGPTIIYGRSVELGGIYAPASWRGTSAMAGFPYMQPAFKKFQPMAMRIVRKHLAPWSKR
jgi:hypothetical protein